jgi:hypothetical protein
MKASIGRWDSILNTRRATGNCCSDRHTTGTSELQGREYTTHPQQSVDPVRASETCCLVCPAHPAYTHPSIYLLDPFRSSGQLGSIRINFSLSHTHTPPFLQLSFIILTPFHCICLLYVSFSYPNNITTVIQWSPLSRNSQQEAGLPQRQDKHWKELHYPSGFIKMQSSRYRWVAPALNSSP